MRSEKPIFKGIENADILNDGDSNEYEDAGFSINHKEKNFSRLTDVILVCSGAICSSDRGKVEPIIEGDKTQYFEVP